MPERHPAPDRRQPFARRTSARVPAAPSIRQAMLEPELAREVNQGLARHRLGDLMGAARIYRGILERRPNLPRVLHLLALALLQAGDPEAALVLAERAVAEAPSMAPAQCCLGLALVQLEQTRAARAQFRRALAVDRLLADAYAGLGGTFARDGEAESARRAFALALALDPAQPQNLGNMATTLQELTLAQDGLLWAKRMVAAAPLATIAHTTAALAEARLGAPRRAAAAAKRALTLMPADSPGYMRLARYLAELGQEASAIDQQRRAVALDRYALAYVLKDMHAKGVGQLWLDVGAIKRRLAGGRA